MTKLQQDYDNACNAYLKTFCEQYDMQYDDDAWVAREVGTIAEVSDLFLSMQDIKLCVDKNVKWEDLIQWYDYNLDAHAIGLDTINLNSWLMGCPRTSKEKMTEIFAMRRNLEELINEEKERTKKRNECETNS